MSSITVSGIGERESDLLPQAEKTKISPANTKISPAGCRTNFNLRVAMFKSFNVSEILYLQTPFETVFGIFDSEAKSSQFVANLVAGSPILVALCL